MRSIFGAVLFVLPICTGCSLGEGEGDVKSDLLSAKDCWTGSYDLQPDFFAAVPSQDSVNIRVQRGTDIQEVSDGLAVLIEDLGKVHEGWIDKPMVVTLSPGILPPGATFPSPPPEGQPPVHVALYMQKSCHNQNTVLYAIGGSVTFHSLFSGDLNEDNAAEKFTDAEFSVWMGDPRDAPVGKAADQIPAENQSQVTGFFRFYFERGQPGQPFP
ncbi:MAG TPA: hypothetical protein PK156_27940 [Polyangium sp.]|nr:hypothetical protein [Polyangium sp.]